MSRVNSVDTLTKTHLFPLLSLHFSLCLFVYCLATYNWSWLCDRTLEGHKYLITFLTHRFHVIVPYWGKKDNKDKQTITSAGRPHSAVCKQSRLSSLSDSPSVPDTWPGDGSTPRQIELEQERRKSGRGRAGSNQSEKNVKSVGQNEPEKTSKC